MKTMQAMSKPAKLAMKTSRSSIAVDLDDTIVDTISIVEGFFGPRPDPLDYFHPAVNHKEFWENSKIACEIFKYANPVKGAADVLGYLAQSHTIIYLTARPEWSKHLSSKWLLQNGFPESPVVCAKNKRAFIEKHNISVMFEDNRTQIEAIEPIVPVFVHAQSWNQGLKNRFTWEGRINENPRQNRENVP